MVGRFWRPSRIQTKSPVGAYYLDNLYEDFAKNYSYYLVDNPKYKYYWVDAVDNEFIKNSVAVSQDTGPFRFPIGKAVINGKTIIGLTDGVGGLIFPNENGNQHVVVQYQILACDPVPKNKCGELEFEFIEILSYFISLIVCKFSEFSGSQNDPEFFWNFLNFEAFLKL